MKLKLQHVGPIAEAELAFGDLTVLVGPQATGKSIALQLLKLMVDTGHVQDVMIRHGLDWSRKLPDFLDAYLGEGMRGIWSNAKSTIWWRGQQVDMSKIAGQLKKRKNETMFYLPAQRSCSRCEMAGRGHFPTTHRGTLFPSASTASNCDNSSKKEFGGGGDLFPQPRRLKREFRELLAAHVFGDFHLRVDKIGPQKRLVLGENGETLPLHGLVRRPTRIRALALGDVLADGCHQDAEARRHRVGRHGRTGNGASPPGDRRGAADGL